MIMIYKCISSNTKLAEDGAQTYSEYNIFIRSGIFHWPEWKGHTSDEYCVSDS